MLKQIGVFNSYQYRYGYPNNLQLNVGGPKLRKWYGAPDLLPKDGPGEEENDSQGTQ